MRRAWRGALVAALGLCAIAAAAVGWWLSRPAEPKAPPVPEARLPRPPQQGRKAAPLEAEVPRPLAEAVQTLFAQGFGDPRGCEYREVALSGAAPFLGDSSKPFPPTHAWVLPSDSKQDSRHAVAWNGLVYPLTRVGPTADLEADVRALCVPIASKGPVRARGTPIHLLTASQFTVTPAKVVLLLRLGREEWALRLWRSRVERDLREITAGIPDGRGWYAELASAWAQDLLERAGMAHAQGDDQLALASLRELRRIRPLLLAKAGDVKSMGVVDRWNRQGIAPYFDFLNVLPELLADQERRVRSPRRDVVAIIAKPSADRDARIAELIDALEDVCIDTSPDLAAAPVVRALVREGDAAVAPLIDALEHDDRLTRAVERSYRHPTRSTPLSPGQFRMWQSFDQDIRHLRRYLRIHRVEEAAHAALVAILETGDFGPASRAYNGRADRPRRAAIAAEIRTFRERFGGVPAVERWYRILDDDRATVEQWLTAAQSLIEPIDVIHTKRMVMVPVRAEGNVPTLRGERLRDRVQPTLTELMTRRCNELNTMTQIDQANQMATMLAAWDLPAALPTLKEQVTRTSALLRPKEVKDSADGWPVIDGLRTSIARFTMMRVRGGDPKALDDYAAWIRSVSPTSGHHFFDIEFFEPMWMYPDHPAIAASARAMFAERSSPWVPLFDPNEAGWARSGFRSDLIVSPMLGVESFRALVLAGLADDRPSGSIECDAEGKARIRIDQRLSVHYTYASGEPGRPKPGEVIDLRLSDHYAWKLRQVDGFPRFEFYWPKLRRDRVIAEDIALLGRYGERFRMTAIALAHRHRLIATDSRRKRAMLAFEPLEGPATVADLEAGRSLFTMKPGALVRTWPSPAVPIDGRWTTLAIDPDDPDLSRQPVERPSGKQTATALHLQAGTVWQAEEVHEGGHWHRYYGFVGRHRVVRVPAEEMDFPAPWGAGWCEVTRDLDIRITPTDTAPAMTMGQPVPIVVTLRNRRGIDTTAPIEFARPGADGPELRDVVSVRVFRAPDIPLPMHPDDSEPPRWPEIPARRVPRRFASSAVRTLAPARSVDVLRLDLRDLFDLDRPGRYRVEITIGAIPTEVGTPLSISGYFQVKPVALRRRS